MNKKLKKLLYRSFDAELSVKEREMLEIALRESPVLQREFEQLKELRSAAKPPQASFKPFFAERVVNAIKAQKRRTQEDFFMALNYMFRRIALIGVIAVILMLSIMTLENGWQSSIADYALSQMTLDELVDPTLITLLEDTL